MTDIRERQRAMIWGSLVADAASMGLHWLYDQSRIRAVAPDQPEFHAPSSADYEGVAGYFAHPARKPGDFSQYGEQAMVMLRAVAGGYSLRAYQRMFRDHFGYGGAYVGYIDRPTRDTLDKMTRLEQEALVACRDIDPSVEDSVHAAIITRVTSARAGLDGPELNAAIETAVRQYSDHDHLVAYGLKINKVLAAYDRLPGADDVQLPAVSKLPPLVARFFDASDLDGLVDEAVRVTNNSDAAVSWSQVVANLLTGILKTGAMHGAEDLSSGAPNDIAKAVSDVLARSSETTEDITAEIGLPCYLRMGIPSVLHNLSRAKSFEEGVRTNIYAGGDNCGRSIILGAALGALFGVPEEWKQKLIQQKAVAQAITAAIPE